LDIGKKVGGALDFVKNRPFRIVGQESARVIERNLANIGFFKGNLWQFWESSPDEGGLARLARAGQGNHREVFRQGNYLLAQCSVYHGLTPA
jgi:hypothetical protein